jgi:catechol 2,3-dioxygenase-like lactoylglutathione lyase family enzyme
MPKLLNVMPFLRCASTDEAAEFFTDILGFRLAYREGHYARVSRDDVTFLLMGEGRPLTPRGGGRYTSYVDVDDVDALYAELKPKLDRLPPGHVNPPCDMEYGQRDFSVLGPDGDLIGFGCALGK